MILDLRGSENKEGVFELIADTFMSTEVMLFKLLALISLIVFSIFGSGSNSSDSNLLLVQRGSKFLSEYVISDGFVAAEAIISDDYL